MRTLRSAAGSSAPPPATFVRHFCQEELARRWRISARTLERWRWMKRGPAFLKIGGRVAYRLEDIEAFEAKQRRAVTTVSDPFFQAGR
jgi:hypothetical protein